MTRANRLERALIQREMAVCFALLDEVFCDGRRLATEEYESFSLILSLAQGVDLGYRDLAFFEEQFTPFVAMSPLQVDVSQYLRLKLAEGYLLLAGRRHGSAADLFQALLHLHETTLPPILLFVATFWLARARRQEGNFHRALLDIRTAKECAEGMGALNLVAVTKIHESWLVFHKGDRRLAFELLDQAHTTLLPTGHALSLGNIAAARGRFIRSTGDYQRSLGFFHQAIEIYREHYPDHPNLGRALVNAAYVKRLLMLELQPRRGEPTTAAMHAQALAIGQEAMELLRDASRIYARHQHQGGSGSVLINLGHLKLESGEIDGAAEEAEAAYCLGEEKEDRVLMARARILQAYVEMACAEEQLDDPLSPLSSADKAAQLADEAVSLAESTQNRRLLAGAYITRGLAGADFLLADWDLARKCAAKASDLLGSGDRDHLLRELHELKRKIAQPQTVDDTFRRWSNGELGDKSFRQIEEQFAEIVIPKVWMNLGRNVSRVAQQLNISPKKVRRILRNVRSSGPDESIEAKQEKLKREQNPSRNIRRPHTP